MECTADDDLPLPVKVARGSAFALWSLSKSERNKAVIKKSGGLPLLAGYAIVLNGNILIYTIFHYVYVFHIRTFVLTFFRLVRMKQTSILIPVIGTLQVNSMPFIEDWMYELF